jgi:hypothetical protein
LPLAFLVFLAFAAMWADTTSVRLASTTCSASEFKPWQQVGSGKVCHRFCRSAPLLQGCLVLGISKHSTEAAASASWTGEMGLGYIKELFGALLSSEGIGLAGLTK